MLKLFLMIDALLSNPSTGDNGLSPVIIVLIIICSALIIGCIIWAFFISKRGAVVKTKKVSETDEQTTEHNIVEPIENTIESDTDKNE